MLNIGIVGLPNVGKSTLFNALLRAKKALAANYPFATIDPNVGIVEVPDERLRKLAEITKPEKIIPATVEFHDIAGLVKGASTGEGLGNQFLAHIRECDAIVQIARGFEDADIIHVHGDVNPKRDREIIETELMLADLQTLEKRVGKAESEAKSGKKDAVAYLAILKKTKDALEKGVMLNRVDFTEEEKNALKDLHFLTMKPQFFVLNVKEDQLTDEQKDKKNVQKIPWEEPTILICAKIEEELADIPEQEAQELLSSIGIKESGLNALVKKAYETLHWITYFTAGPKK